MDCRRHCKGEIADDIEKKKLHAAMIETKHMKTDAVTGMGITAETETSFLLFCVVHDNCHDAVGNEEEILSEMHCKYHLCKLLQRLSYS